MSLFKLNPIENITKEVSYAGGNIDIPANHNYLGVVRIGSPGGMKHVLASFADEPRVSGSGNLVAEGEWLILMEVHEANPTESLRKVGDLDTEEVIIYNTEELVNKLTTILGAEEASVEEKIHAMFCPDHGVLVDFLRHSNGALSNHFDTNKDNAAEGESISLEEVLPAEALAVIGGLLAAIQQQAGK